jgi:hypothetical protein|tara:strand:- start:707 stop:1012 length:306 start_codon:yes stop_codon:yes gene_type:complete
MARPKKYKIDTEQVKKLAQFGCTNKEIGEFFGCSADLIEKSYSEFLIKGRANGKIRLRQLQWSSAEKGNVAMLIFLGKNILGQQDKLEENQLETPLPWSND